MDSQVAGKIDIDKIKETLKERFFDTMDLNITEVIFGDIRTIVAFMEGCADKASIERNLLRPLTMALPFELKDVSKAFRSAVTAAEGVDTLELDCFDEIVQKIAEGDSAVFVEGHDSVELFSIRGQQSRGVAEPPTSTVLKGPREGFVENMIMNLQLLRKRLRTPNFVNEPIKIGKYSNTTVIISYINGIADKKIVKKIKDNLKQIQIDGIIDSSYLTEHLKEHKHSMLKQIGTSEKPDIVAAKLLEGRVALICDGSPIVLTIPFILLEDLQDSSDYYRNDVRAVTLRLIRTFGVIGALLLPGFYVAIMTQHYQLMPMNFLVSLISTMRRLPFTVEVEMIFVLIIFEVINEASVRVPQYIGMALAFIGAIILGEVAATAGLMSAPTVLIAALSNMGIYLVPDQVSSFSLFRMIFVVSAALFGFFGLLMAVVFVLAFMLTHSSYGAPYLSPFAPMIANDMKDALDKSNLLSMKSRPQAFASANKTRQR